MKELNKAYRVMQEASGIDVGDTVHIIREWRRGELGEAGSLGYSFNEFGNLGDDCLVTAVFNTEANCYINVKPKNAAYGSTAPFFALKIIKKTVKLPSKIEINPSYSAKFNADKSIDVGCQHIEFEALEAIYLAAKSIDQQ